MERTVLEVSPGALSDYYDWLKAAASGDVLVYWSGDLQYDRQVVIPENDVLRGHDRLRLATLNILADRILEDAKDGHVLLTQKRLGTNIFEYRATRRRQDFGSAKPKINTDDLVLA
ncbi:hypothetical protein [Bradyrhizobium sp. SZCCHNRI2010]|uniref:hypothetical protein n=1 Tax=Bradyrhizobium sp. SZCCHNRI2010 TaxID=3057283 RepID=UPI0028EC1DDD|nr:hypothetical protein [Bradyrhizobium sp. SZCCHNRI2010]